MAKDEAAKIRRLNTALGMRPQRSGWPIALTLIALFGAAMIAFGAPLAPPTTTYGSVLGLIGPRSDVYVTVDGRQLHVSLPPGHLCQAGDRIALQRRKMRLTTAYSIVPPGCTRA